MKVKVALYNNKKLIKILMKKIKLAIKYNKIKVFLKMNNKMKKLKI
jgi:hypothetical protein